MKTTRHLWSYPTHFFLEWEMSQTKFLEEIRFDILCTVTFKKKNPTVYEIMCKDVVKWGRPQMTIWRLRIACWTPKAPPPNHRHTHTHAHTHAHAHTRMHTHTHTRTRAHAHTHTHARTRTHAHTLVHTHTHSQYVILIAFPLQQWLHERASMWRLYVCLACHVYIYFSS